MVDPIKANRDNYALQLDMLQVMARRDLLALWSGDPGESWHNKTIALNEMYPEIVHDYGLQAAAAAADYVFIQRSLDDELSLLAYPDLAEPADRKQALAGLNWALKDVRREQTEQDLQAARVKAEKVLTRLVLQPARDTVYYNAEKAGARFLVMPSPRACAFCLMLASRGAVYHDKDRVGGWHDGCRCIGIEGNPRDERTWPRINRELQDAWYEKEHAPGSEHYVQKKTAQRIKYKTAGPKDAQKHKPSDHAPRDYSREDLHRWEYYLEHHKHKLRELREFPNIPGVEIPPEKSRTATLSTGEVIDVPSTRQFAGHVMYGWKQSSTHLEMFTLDKSKGHMAGSRKKGKAFPGSWKDQDVVDNIYAALDTDATWHLDRRGDGLQRVFKVVGIDGVPVKVQFYRSNSGVSYGMTAFPPDDKQRGGKNGTSAK